MRRRRQPPPASSEHYRVKAVEQTLAILDVLAESPDLALPEIAERIGLATPNAHKLILHLQEAGLVETALVTKRYRLGARRLAQLTERALETASPWEAFRASVTALRETTGMHGLFAVLVGARVVYVEHVRGPDDAAGRAFPAHATALGKALLAEAPAAVLDEVVLDAWSARTITDRARLEADLDLDAGARLGSGGWRARPRQALDRGGGARPHWDGGGGRRHRRPHAAPARRRLPGLAAHVVAAAAAVTDAFGGALGTLARPRLDVTVLGAVEPPVPPAPRTDTPAGRRAPRRSRARE